MLGLTKKSKDKKKTKKDKKVEEEVCEEESEEGQQVTLVDLLAGGAEETGPESRSIMFVGEVTEEKSADLISALLVLAQTKDEDEERAEDIKLYLSTYGGSADEMFGIYDVINFCKQFCDIETIGLGKVMSAGVLLLASGAEGCRFIGRNTRVMIHSLRAGHAGAMHELETEYEETKWLQDQYIQALSSVTNMNKRMIKKMMERKTNVYINAEQAIEYGIADKLLDQSYWDAPE